MKPLGELAAGKGEILFEISITFLPIGLLFIMFGVFGDWRRVLEHEEWLFVSAVLQAQAFGKLFIASDHEAIKNKPMLYTVAICLVLKTKSLTKCDPR